MMNLELSIAKAVISQSLNPQRHSLQFRTLAVSPWKMQVEFQDAGCWILYMTGSDPTRDYINDANFPKEPPDRRQIFMQGQ